MGTAPVWRAAAALLGLLALAAPAAAGVSWDAPVEVRATPVPTVAGDQPFVQTFDAIQGATWYHPDASGATARAFRGDNRYHLLTTALRMTHTEGELAWSTQLAGQGSNDPGVTGQARPLSELTAFRSELRYGDAWRAELGNLNPDYHRYALAGGFDGVAGSYRFQPGTRADRIEVGAAAGRAARGIDDRFLLRTVGACQLTYVAGEPLGIVDGLTAGAALARVIDNPASVRQPAGLAAVESLAGAFRVAGRLPDGFSFESDLGFGSGRLEVDGAPARQKLFGNAWALALGWDRPAWFADPAYPDGKYLALLPARARVAFELVDGDYLAPLAAAPVNQRLFTLGAVHPFTDWAGLTWSFARIALADDASCFAIDRTAALTLAPFRPVHVRRLIASPTFAYWELDNLAAQFAYGGTARHQGDGVFVTARTEQFELGLSHTLRRWLLAANYRRQETDNLIDRTLDRTGKHWRFSCGRSWELAGADPLAYGVRANLALDREGLGSGVQSSRTRAFDLGGNLGWRQLEFDAGWELGYGTQFQYGPAATRTENQGWRGGVAYVPAAVPDLRFAAQYRWQRTTETDRSLDYRSDELRGDLTCRF